MSWNSPPSHQEGYTSSETTWKRILTFSPVSMSSLLDEDDGHLCQMRMMMNYC